VVQGSWFKFFGLWFRVLKGLGLRFTVLGFRVRVQGIERGM